MFERSHIPLNKWLYAICLFVNNRGKISSVWLSKELGVTQKSAWFMLHRLSEARRADSKILSDIVEEMVSLSVVKGQTAREKQQKRYRRESGGGGAYPGGMGENF